MKGRLDGGLLLFCEMYFYFFLGIVRIFFETPPHSFSFSLSFSSLSEEGRFMPWLTRPPEWNGSYEGPEAKRAASL